MQRRMSWIFLRFSGAAADSKAEARLDFVRHDTSKLGQYLVEWICRVRVESDRWMDSIRLAPPQAGTSMAVRGARA